MSQDISYTTDELAKILKISKLTVYDLIKKGELPSYRVGRQMRVDGKDLAAYKERAKSGGQTANVFASPQQSQSPPSSKKLPSTIVMTGQDISMDLLAKYLERAQPTIRPLRSYVGSMDSLISMYQGNADLVSVHLLDGDTGEYNVPYIRKLLVGQPCLVVGLAARTAGFYVQKGNPCGFHQWEDLRKPSLRLINREKGSGARVLLDEQLRLHGITASGIRGYEQEADSHLAVAGTVASGEADVGIGIEKAALVVGIDFMPLIQERLDIVMLKTHANQALISSVVSILRSESFKRELRSIGGYDVSQTGEILLES